MEKAILKQIFKWSLKTSLRLHTAGLTSSHKYSQTTAGHVLLRVEPITTKKALLSWCSLCRFLPNQRHEHIFQRNWKWTSSIQALNLFQTFCSSRAMKRHHHMEKPSLEQLISHLFRGRTNPKGYVTNIFLKSILNIQSNRIYRKKHKEILAVD